MLRKRNSWLVGQLDVYKFYWMVPRSCHTVLLLSPSLCQERSLFVYKIFLVSIVSGDLHTNFHLDSHDQSDFFSFPFFCAFVIYHMKTAISKGYPHCKLNSGFPTHSK